MPSKNMIRKGKRRQTVKHEYRLYRDAVREAEAAERTAAEAQLFGAAAPAAAVEAAAVPEVEALDARPADEDVLPFQDIDESGGVRRHQADPSARGKRLDAYLAKALPEISRARVQLLIEKGQVRVGGKPAKASLKLEGGEWLEIEGEPQPEPLRAEPEDIPLRVVYEDADLAAIDKPAGMTVHAGAGDAEHNRGTLVNALLFHFEQQLSQEGGALRPGIVHRLDKETSGLILVAKNDVAHRRLAEMFQDHTLRKVYVALVHGVVPEEKGTIDLPVGRDLVRRTRMTTKRSVASGARAAVSQWRVLERIGTKANPGPWGLFTLLGVEIETGRTHQIRVHLQALGHPVVGDTLYGAPARLRRPGVPPAEAQTEPTLSRNFLHAAELDFVHPRTGIPLYLRAPLPEELEAFLQIIRPTHEGSRSEAEKHRELLESRAE